MQNNIIMFVIIIDFMSEIFLMFEKTKYFIIDMDGTFYLGDEIIPGSDKFISYIRSKGKDFYFFTNNSSHNEEECMNKLDKIGFPVDRGRVIISSHVAIDFIKRNRPGKKVFLLANENFTNDCIKENLLLDNENPDIILLGFDTTLTYDKINRACNLLYYNKNTEFIATHPDKNCPLKDEFMTDTGSMIEMFYASSGRRPDIIIGKPYRYTIDYVTHRLNCAEDEICFIGDRIETDVAIGYENGIDSVLVYSGVTTPEMYRNQNIKATLDVKNLKELCNYI